MLALNPATGKVKWYYQFTPHDTHDWDANTPDRSGGHEISRAGSKTAAACRSKRLFLCLRPNGRPLLLARSFVKRMTWASGIDDRGRPVALPDTDVTCPDSATNWNGTAYSPVTRLYYVVALEKCQVKLTPGGWKTDARDGTGAEVSARASIIDTGKIAWEIPEVGPTDGKRDGGVLATAGGMVFYGDSSGDFSRSTSGTGKPYGGSL